MLLDRSVSVNPHFPALLGDGARRSLALLRPMSCGVAIVACLTITAETATAQSSTIVLSGDPPPLIVGTAIAGDQPLPGIDGSTIYSVTVAAGEKITAFIDGAMPPGVTLEVTLAAPQGAVSVGPVVLTTVPQDVVRSIPAGTFSGLSIRYTLRATVAAGVVSPRWRVVSFAVVAGP
jgi:hypothetical protein